MRWRAVFSQEIRTGRSAPASKATISRALGSGGSIATIARFASTSPLATKTTETAISAINATRIRRSM
jgi:hypothetical protein